MWNALKGYAQRCHARVLTFELGREEGQGLVEYSLILALISIAAILVMGELGTRIGEIFTEVKTAL